jgi:hypothetical protein
MAVAVWLAAGDGVVAQKPPLLPEKDVAVMANELSGETSKRNLEDLARFHRQRGSTEFHSAAELVAEHLRAGRKARTRDARRTRIEPGY